MIAILTNFCFSENQENTICNNMDDAKYTCINVLTNNITNMELTIEIGKIVAMIQRLNSNSTKSICVEMIFINEYSTLFAYIYDCV